MAVKLPPLRQAIACLAALGLWLVVTALFVGFRPEHAVLALLLAAMFFLTLPGRRLALALLPFFYIRHQLRLDEHGAQLHCQSGRHRRAV